MGMTNEAVAIFQWNVEAYSNSFNVYDSLGEAFLQLGDKESGGKNYKKSLELNPNNTNAAEVLKRLERQ
jgi:tetratricopeptide (TPR) repeat protein